MDEPSRSEINTHKNDPKNLSCEGVKIGKRCCRDHERCHFRQLWLHFIHLM